MTAPPPGKGANNNEAFIMREHGSGTRQAVQKLLAKHKLSVRVRLELGSNEAIKQAIAGGLGISVLSKHTLYCQSSEWDITILDVEGLPIQRQWYVSYLQGKQLSVVAQAFLEYLHAQSKKMEINSTVLSK